jgi:16S rRNA (uracil1498-N3)-methyltransferase
MALPFFYTQEIKPGATQFFLGEETSKHAVQVLRMQNGEQLLLTDGKGNLFTTEIIDDNRKKCAVKILSETVKTPPAKKITIAISLIKNSTRFEWFLEKATEIGVTEIIPLLCSRTEKQFFRHDRMKNILVSAMLQSQQCWLPLLHETTKFMELVNQSTVHQKFIAHCEEGEKKQLHQHINSSAHQLVCIGPEGDFTPDEIAAAIQNNFLPVALGNTRLRTETAGVVAAALLCTH